MTGPRREGVLDGPTRTAAEHRAAAGRALEAGDADTAVLEAYRALTRSAIERTLLDDLPGRTAHEVAVALGPVFPASALVTRRRRRHLRRRALRAALGQPRSRPATSSRSTPTWRAPDRCCPTRPPRQARDERPRSATPTRRGGAAPRAGTGTGCAAPRAYRRRGRSGAAPRGAAGPVGAAARPQPLDPEGTGPDGARALAEVLRQQGVEVEVVRSIDALEAARPDADDHRVRRRPHRPRRRGPPPGSPTSARSAGRLVLVGVDERAAGAARAAGRGLRRGRQRPRRRGATPSVARSNDVGVGLGRPLRADRRHRGRTLVLRAPLGRRPARRARPGRRLRRGHGRARRHRGTTPRRSSPASARPGRTRTSPTTATPAPRCVRSARRPGWSGTSPASATLVAPGPGGVDSPDDQSVWPRWTDAGRRAAAGHRRAPRARPGPPARSPRARAAARRGARHRDHREPRAPLPPGRRPGPRRGRAALRHRRAPRPPARRGPRRRAGAPSCTRPRSRPGDRAGEVG